jgi:hypothetical protein
MIGEAFPSKTRRPPTVHAARGPMQRINMGEPAGNHLLPEGNNEHYPRLGTAPGIAADCSGGTLRWAKNIKFFNV